MAGTKYTRKPEKKVTKKQAVMKKINKGINKTIARNKKNEGNASKALKQTARKLGKGAMAVASMSPAGKAAKAYKTGKKAAKVLRRGPGSLPKNKSAYLKGDFKYKKNLEKRISDIDDKPLTTATKKRPGKVKEMTKKRAEKELDLLDTDMTYEERAKILGGFKKGGAVKSKCKIDGIAQRGRTRAKRK